MHDVPIWLVCMYAYVRMHVVAALSIWLRLALSHAAVVYI